MSTKADDTPPDFYTRSRHVYAFRHRLNTVDIFTPKDGVPTEALWVIYIHGGAWRSPDIDSLSIIPTLGHFDPSVRPVPRVASINYGLSPHPKHESKPSSAGDPSRNNVHPQHLEDVVFAISWIQQKYHIGQNYILAGHSCGATLAFQVLTRSAPNVEALFRVEPRPLLPRGVVGFNGIYDLCQLAKDFAHVPMYREVLEEAFGKDECGKWRVASPVGWPYAELCSGNRLFLLAHSDADELVNWKQTELMIEDLSRKPLKSRVDKTVKLQGAHHEIWSEGHELARTLYEAFDLIKEEIASGRKTPYDDYD